MQKKKKKISPKKESENKLVKEMKKLRQKFATKKNQ